MAVAGLMALGFGGSLQASIVDLGAAGQFGALALTTGIDDSGPLGPDGSVSINADVGVASFSASGSVIYSGDLYLHTGVTYNNSALVSRCRSLKTRRTTPSSRRLAPMLSPPPVSLSPWG